MSEETPIYDRTGKWSGVVRVDRRQQPNDALDGFMERFSPDVVEAVAREFAIEQGWLSDDDATTDPKPVVLKEWRCPTCGRLLMKLSCAPGSNVVIQISCPKCRALVVKEQAA